MSVRRCPECGCDGGDGDTRVCCACGFPCAIYVRGPDAPGGPVPFTSTLTDSGSQEVGCCPVQQPFGGDCPISPLTGVGGDSYSGIMQAGGPGFGTGCGASGFQNETQEAFVSDCNRSSTRNGSRDIDFWANSGYEFGDDRICPQVIFPSKPGAIYSWDRDGPNVITMWGGSQFVRGPIVLVHQERMFWADPGGGGAGVGVWIFVGMGGGAAVIAVTAPRCATIACGVELGTVRIAGGASVAGTLGCDGQLSAGGACNASVTVGCELGPNDECITTGEHISDFEFSVGLDLASIVRECTESPGSDRDSQSDIDDQDAADGFFIPEVFLQTSPELRAAYERLRQHFGNTDNGGQTQVPPPNGVQRAAGDWF